MFVPEGFLNFSELSEIAREISRDLCWAFRSKQSKRKSQNPGIVVEQGPREREAVECWLIANLFQNVNVFVCSPQGVVLRGPAILSNHIDQIEMLPCPIPIEDSTLTSPTPSSSFELRDYFYFHRGFLYFDWDTGQIKSTKKIKKAIRHTSGFSEDTRTYISERDAELSSSIKKYEGWSLCVKESEFDVSEAQVLQAFGVHDELIEKINAVAAFPFQIHDEPRKGRPRKRDNAKDAYWKIFPDGHKAAGVSLKSATNAVSDELGQIISDDTLLRALGKKK